MNTAIIVMTILGCGHGENTCEYIRTVNDSWTSQTACQAQTETHLRASADENYPNVIAVCVDKPLPQIAKQPVEPPAVRDVVVREADALDLIYDALPDGGDARAVAATLSSLAVSGARSVSEWLW